jgi:ribosomal protein S18 acetylase RimI-like enzyme
VIVRAASPADAEAMARVHWLSANTAYGRDDSYEERLTAYREGVFALPEVRPFLAEHDGEVIGVANVGDRDLYALYVRPDWWGRGVAQLLIDRAESALAETCETARLTVLTDNDRARRFYERNGWELVERVEEPHFGGLPTDVCRYSKALSNSRS